MAAKPIEFDAEGGKLQVSIKATGGIEALYAIIFWPDPEQNPQDRRILTAFKSTRGGRVARRSFPSIRRTALVCPGYCTPSDR